MRLKGKSQIDRAIGQRLRAYRLARRYEPNSRGRPFRRDVQAIDECGKGVNRYCGTTSIR